MKKIIDLNNSHFNELIREAKKSTCCRSKCGSIIINNNIIIGSGYNSQPCDVEGTCFKDNLSKDFKSDRTCCIHAEQRAILDAIKNNSHLVKGSVLYFIRLDENDNPKISGDPYCTICSKLALDVGIGFFTLLHSDGWTAYETDYYNKLSFKL